MSLCSSAEAYARFWGELGRRRILAAIDSQWQPLAVNGCQKSARKNLTEVAKIPNSKQQTPEKHQVPKCKAVQEHRTPRRYRSILEGSRLNSAKLGDLASSVTTCGIGGAPSTV
jgi:hypothetical protein